jgi:hypothetical protein
LGYDGIVARRRIVVWRAAAVLIGLSMAACELVAGLSDDRHLLAPEGPESGADAPSGSDGGGDSATPPPPPPPPTDSGFDGGLDAAPDVDAETIRCGSASCAVTSNSLCCFPDAAAGAVTPTCTTPGACNGARMTCDNLSDCRALGFDAPFICCIFHDENTTDVLRSECILASDCDTSGPQDPACDPARGPAECADAAVGGPNCLPYNTANGGIYYICVN